MDQDCSLIDFGAGDPGGGKTDKRQNQNDFSEKNQNRSTRKSSSSSAEQILPEEVSSFSGPPSPAPAQLNYAQHPLAENTGQSSPKHESSEPEMTSDAQLIEELVRATQYGNFQICRTAIDDGFDVNLRDREDVTLLHWAAINNRLELAKYFVTKGAFVDAIGGELRSTPLHWAVRQRHLQMIIYLMQNHADPSILDGDGYNCLHVAAQLGYTSVVAYLVAKGQNIDESDRQGMTPLMWAAFRQNT